MYVCSNHAAVIYNYVLLYFSCASFGALGKICVLTLCPLATGQFSDHTRLSETAIMIGLALIGIIPGVIGSLLCDVFNFDYFIVFRIVTYVIGVLCRFHWLAPSVQPVKDLIEPQRSNRVVSLVVLSSETALWCCSTIVESFWAHLVDPSSMDVGLLYALYCFFFYVIGGYFFRVTRIIRTAPRYTLTLSCLLAAIGMFFAAAAMPANQDSVLVIIMAMLAFHFAIGLWGAVLCKLRNCAMLSPLNEAYARCVALRKYFDTQYFSSIFALCFLFVLITLVPIQSLAHRKKKPRFIRVLRSRACHSSTA
ncbi:hypothetical protein HPB51_018993 [Rhipicephalus microplus]|uniref:Uncharacterized protein n=1 Tax=Rhipicephalus microplus TaxID=6941 RepID=A0A9J6D6L8_RHIMP|nr:hypothetical protein HPB51_018993 [Rhipicephalus microplus]